VLEPQQMGVFFLERNLRHQLNLTRLTFAATKRDSGLGPAGCPAPRSRCDEELPDFLSDLVPRYLPDSSTLICPVHRRTGVDNLCWGAPPGWRSPRSPPTCAHG
jgi:hypothetical protein